MSKTVNCRDVHNNHYDVPVEDLVWRPAVYGIVIRDNKVLLSKEFDGYDFPGGGIDLGESIAEALVREVKEESGYTVAPGEHVLTAESFYHGLKGTNFQGIQIYYRCSIVGGELSTAFLTEIEREYDLTPEWVDLSRLESIKFMGSSNTRHALELALKRNELP